MILRLIVLLIVVWALTRRRRPLPSKPNDNATRFSYSNATAQTVFLAGDFNHWSTTATPMQSDQKGNWSIGLSLPPGKYQYKFVADGKWFQDFANPDAARDGMGGHNSVLTVPR
jgi:1,4-alpha-glucan branching enzyme